MFLDDQSVYFIVFYQKILCFFGRRDRGILGTIRRIRQPI